MTSNLDYFRTLLPDIHDLLNQLEAEFYSNFEGSNFLNVQETKSSVSQQCRIRTNLFGRSLKMGWITSIAIAELCYRSMFAFRRTLSRPSGKRHSLSHSIDHMSVDEVDHVPSSIPGNSFPVMFYNFEDNEAVIRMIMEGRSPNVETRVTNSPC